SSGNSTRRTSWWDVTITSPRTTGTSVNSPPGSPSCATSSGSKCYQKPEQREQLVIRGWHCSASRLTPDESCTQSHTSSRPSSASPPRSASGAPGPTVWGSCRPRRSEEHTSELQSRFDLVCRLL